MFEPIGGNDFERATGAAGWRVVGDGACTYFATGSLAEGARLAGAIASIPGIDEGPPDIDVRPNGLTVRLLTQRDDYYGMSKHDVELAGAITDVAAGLGFQPDPTAVQSILLVVGAPDISKVV